MRFVAMGIVLAAGLFAWSALAVEPINTGRFGNVAIKGADVVAYFDGAYAEGSKKFVHSWNGADWRFVNATNRDRFAADPEAFAPQFGGYCAWAVSQGKTANIDPEQWKIVDGKLYLNYNKKIQKRWEKDVPGNIAKAEGHWPDLVD